MKLKTSTKDIRLLYEVWYMYIITKYYIDKLQPYKVSKELFDKYWYYRTKYNLIINKLGHDRVIEIFDNTSFRDYISIEKEFELSAEAIGKRTTFKRSCT